MRKLLVIVLLMVFAIPESHARGFVPQKVTIAQLRQRLAELRGKSDKKIARKLADLEITERLSRSAYKQLSESLPGEQSRAALLGVADASAFLEPPQSEALRDAPPSAQQQHEMLLRAAKFAGDQTEGLPAFAVSRTTRHFQDVLVYPYSNLIEYYTPGSFRFVDTEVDDILCAAGGDQVREIPDKDLDKSLARQPQPLMGATTIWGDLTGWIPNPSPTGLKPTGAFGPWLEALTGDVPEGQSEWAYWERAGSTLLAVFRFRISQEKSHYTIEYRFIPDLKDPEKFDPGRKYAAAPGYHGEIALDPVTGQIARILVVCDFAKGDPMLKAAVVLEYGPVRIDGDTYVLPLRGVSSSSVSVTSNRRLFDGYSYIGTQTDHYTVSTVDDLSFSDYGVSRPRIRIVPLKSLDRPVK